MALRDEIREQKKLLKGKGFKAYLQWFADYQLTLTIVIVCAAALIIYMAFTMITAKGSAFGVMFLNASVADDQPEILEEEFIEYAGIDGSQYEIYADLDESHSISGSETTMDIYSTMAIQTRLAAGQIDVMVADAYMFENYAQNSYFMDLTEVLDEETLERFSDLLYYVDMAVIEAELEAQDNAETLSSEEDNAEDDETEEDDGLVSLDEIEEAEESAWLYQDDEDLLTGIMEDNYTLPDPSQMEDPVAVGIVVNSSPYLQANHNFDGYVCIYGVLANTKVPEYCALFLDYLFENE